MSFRPHRGKVARVVPTLAVDSSLGGFLVFVVTQHHIGATNNDFTLDVQRVCRCYLHLHIGQRLSTGAWLEDVVVAIRDKRCTLRSAIAHREGEVDALEELFYLLVQRCATDDDFVGPSAKGVVDLLTDTCLDLLGNDRHLQHNLDGVALYLGEYALADNLLDDQRYGNDDVRLDFLVGLGNDGWRGQTCQEVQVVT